MSTVGDSIVRKQALSGGQVDNGSTMITNEDLRRFQIRELIERFFHALDTRNAPLFQACFAPEATFTARTGSTDELTHRGASAIVAALWQLDRSYQQGSHVVANVAVRLTGDTTAEATTFVIANLLVSQLVVVRGTRLDDRVVYGPDGWVFEHRSHSVLWQYSVPAIIPPIVRSQT
jgi:hypothetical protein